MLAKMPPSKPTPARSRGSAPFRRQLEAVKEAVRIEHVADGYGKFRLTGSGRLLGSCVSPDHEDKSPSLTVYTEQQRFWCYGIGCGAHGDVLDLVMLAESCELWEAMILSTRYGILLSQRPASWFEKQERQRLLRGAIDAEKAQHVRLLLIRLLFVPWLRLLPEGVREEATLSAWQESVPIAWMLYERRRGS